MQCDTHGPDYATLGAFYRQVYGLVDRWDTRLRELGLERRTFYVLAAIKSCPSQAGPSISALTESTLLNRNIVRALLAALARQGLITRTRDCGDRRRAVLALTPRGEEWLALLVRDDASQVASWGPDVVRLLQRLIPGTSARAAAQRSAALSRITPALQRYDVA